MAGKLRRTRLTSDEYGEHRREQNKRAQRRWRERHKNRKSLENLSTGLKRSAHSTLSSCNSQEYTGIRDEGQTFSHPFSDDRNGVTGIPQCSASDIIHALDMSTPRNLHGDFSETCRNDTLQNLELASPPDYKEAGFSLRDLNLSELISLAYCAPFSSRSLFIPNKHFAKALFENSKRLGMGTTEICDHQSISRVGQDWSSYCRMKENSAYKQDLHRKESKLSKANEPVTYQHDTINTPPASESSNFNEEGSSSKNHQMHFSMNWDKVPVNMYPTDYQVRISHHPFIDVGFPWPQVRSKILTLIESGVIDDDELCEDTFKAGLPGADNQNPAFYIWGDDAMDEAAWEVGENFAMKWWFILDETIILRTNWWRRQRGCDEIASRPQVPEVHIDKGV